MIGIWLALSLMWFTIDMLDDGGRCELSLMRNDVRSTVADLGSKGVEFSHAIRDKGFGSLTAIKLPGGDELGS